LPKVISRKTLILEHNLCLSTDPSHSLHFTTN